MKIKSNLYKLFQKDKFILYFSLSFLAMAIFSKPVKADNFDNTSSDASQMLNNYDQAMQSFAKASQDGELSSTPVQEQAFTDTAVAITIHIVGPDTEVLEEMDEQAANTIRKRFGKGALASVGNGMAIAMSSPPASGTKYVASLLQDLKIVPPAYAQGLGYTSLDPILTTWKVFRNVSYLFFTIIFFIIGFMIMFRHKISGQTVVTVQQAIPSIIIAFILVSFSYAIAGFLIDIMYLSMYLIMSLFGGSEDLINRTFIEIGWDLVTHGGSLGNVNQAIHNFVQAAMTSMSSSFWGGVAAWISSTLFGLMIAVAVLWGSIRIFFDLIKTYITIILAITTAPLFLMTGAIPGKNPFKDWISQLVGNLAAFPGLLIMLILYSIVTKTATGTNAIQGGFVPPYIYGAGTGAAFVTLLGVGIILALPEALKEIKKMCGAKDTIFTKLASDALKNAAVGAPMVPYGVGAVTGTAGALRAGYAALKNRGTDGKLSARDLFDVMRSGYQKVDESGKIRRQGGFERWGGAGRDFAQGGRKMFDRVRSGEAVDPETTLKELRAIRKSIDLSRSQEEETAAKGSKGSSGGQHQV